MRTRPISGPSPLSSRIAPWARLAGFTLLEVLLAIGITVGMLVVVLYFYQQISSLRQNLTEELERVTAARQFLLRIHRELSAARPHGPVQFGLYGQSNQLEFITTQWPSERAWQREDHNPANRPQCDLKLVRYELAGPGDPTEATGLARSEGPVPEFAPLTEEEIDLWLMDADPSATASAGFSLTFGEAPEHAAFPLEPENVREFLTDRIRYLRFRFWDGVRWLDQWEGVRLPVAVEVSVGERPVPPPDPAADIFDVEEYPYELFRRVVPLSAAHHPPLVPSGVLTNAAPSATAVESEVFP